MSLNRLRACCFVALALACGSLASAAAPAPSLAAADGIVSAAALPAGCPLERPFDVPVYFHYRVDGPWHRADFAVAVPGDVERIARWLLTPLAYPEWAFTDPQGKPNLREVEIDEPAGEGRVRVGRETWRGRVAWEEHGAVRGLRLTLLGESAVKEAYVEVTLRPAPGCSESASLVTGRVAWKLGWMARLFGGNAKSVPALFALRLRDDVLARSLREPDARASLLGGVIRAEVGGRGIVFVEGPGGLRPAPGDRLLWLEPHMTDSAAAAALARRMEARERVTLGAFLAALDGRHAVIGYLARVERGAAEHPVIVAGDGRSAFYRIHVAAGSAEEPSSMSIQMGFVPATAIPPSAAPGGLPQRP